MTLPIGRFLPQTSPPASLNAVACPYFLPRGKLATGLWVHEPRLPLGDAYSGICHARPCEPCLPSEKRQEDLCNYGYAGGICERFPADGPADAVRFSLASEDRAHLRIVYAIEKEHAPIEFGEFEFSTSTNALVLAPANPVLAAQAEAFARSYLARTGTIRGAVSNGVL
ncbi:MAG TPA: hypothetical protein VH639_03040 [Bryobacteraceae bacterium]